MTRGTVLGVRTDDRAMVRALGLLYIGGPSVAVACVLLPRSPQTEVAPIWVLIVLAYVWVPVIFTQYKRLPGWAVGGLVAFANSLVTAVVYFNHEATSSYAFFYLWVTPYAVVFFSTRTAALHLLYPAVAYAVVLAVHAADGNGAPGGAELSQWLQAMSALAVTALLVRALMGALRERQEAIDAERRSRAIEINDDVVQRLIVARQAYDEGDRDLGDEAVGAALLRARRIMAELLGDEPVEPGALRREEPASDDPLMRP